MNVGPYEIIEKLGSGGMGEVFLCHDARLQRRVALKCLTRTELGTEEADVLREARAAARLTHPHIASVYDVLEHDGRAFIVMEYVEGESLRTRLQRGTLSADQSIAIGRQLASALAAAHAQGVIHRDLKPSNVQVMPNGTVKVLDFGVAKIIPRLDTVTDAPTTTPTTGPRNRLDSPGTPVYMAPEQLISGRADTRSDIYSLGIVMFEMVTGRRPYVEMDAVALAVAMSTSPPPPPDAIDPRVPRRLSSVIVKALQREPFNRYQTAEEFGAALDELVEPTTREVARAQWDRGRRSIRPLIIAAATMLTLAVAGALLWRFGRNNANATVTPVLAILPVDNPTGDPQATYLGDAIASFVASNFRAAGGVKVVSRGSTIAFNRTRTDIQGLKRQLAADYVLDLTMMAAKPTPEMAARFQRSDRASPEWQQTFSGDVVATERSLVERVGRGLSEHSRNTTPNANWIVRPLPTTNGNAVVIYSEARALLERTDVPASLTRAVERLQAATAADPSFALGHATLATALLTQWERLRDPALIDRATPEVTAALRLDPDSSAAHYASGMLQYITGRRDGAVQSLRRAIELDPDADEPHRLLGWRLLSPQGRTDEAVAELREAVRIRPDSFENYYRLGNVLYLAGRHREAVDAYRTATELQPKRADVFTNLGAAYHMLGDVDQALGNYQHAITLGAGDALAYSNLAYNYFLAGRYPEALAAALEAVKRDSTRASLQADLGEYYKRVGNTRAARAAYTKAIELAERSQAVDPRDASAVVLIAGCEANLGRRVEAERRVAEALTLGPSDRNVLLSSAKVYTLLGDTARAFENLRGAIEHGLNPQLARRDPELAPIRRSPEFESAIAAGMRDRERARPVRP
jgi:tetratricopeptide (TPR) repeat protein